MVDIESLRAYKLAGYALFDFVATYLGAWMIARWRGYNTVQLFLILCLLSIPIHLAVGKETRWVKQLRVYDPLAIMMVIVPLGYLMTRPQGWLQAK